MLVDNKIFFRRICMKKGFSSQRRETLFFSSTSIAAVTSAENQQVICPMNRAIQRLNNRGQQYICALSWGLQVFGFVSNVNENLYSEASYPDSEMCQEGNNRPQVTKSTV